ncbi:MAG: DHH family phosphoesterase [candidate division WOR-3 bacterium]|nr:DHH family phosphoesterase [candidate division WOR-3 bacterium]MCX7948330.1 DHH family phosphoesterase [candidate division WOR-3 bacterium]MDW8150842.1 DHH family phosphoesterase [candidate division WOR-3 bacterium]
MNIEQVLVNEYKINPTVADILIKKGINDIDLVKSLFQPTIENLLPPRSIVNMETALKEILKYSSKEGILIWGHDDVDGTSSTAILMKTLRLLGTEPIYYIPKKNSEGHKLNKFGIDFAYEKGIKLIICLDTGISSVDEVEYAKEKGISVIIADHHEIPKILPDAIILNPKMGGTFQHISSSVLSFKIALGLLNLKFKYDINYIIENEPSLIVYASLGVIADRLPLFSENKIIVDTAKELINKYGFTIFSVYHLITGQQPTIYSLIPILSSIFSEGERHLAVELLLSNDEIFVEEQLSKIYKQSKEKLLLLENELQKIKEQIKRIRGYILLDLRHMNSNSIGYIASKVRDYYKVPVIAISKDELGKVVGEIRTPTGYNMLEFLDSISELLINYGGHKTACGFSMENDSLYDFIEECEKFFTKYKPNIEEIYDLILNSFDDEILQNIENLRKLGVRFRILFKGNLKDIVSKLKYYTIVDPNQILSVRAPEHLNYIVVLSAEDGFRIEEIG